MASAGDSDGSVVKIGVCQCIRRRKQVGMVERVEHLHSEGELLAFQLPEMNGEIALDGGIKVNLPRPVDGIASDIARRGDIVACCIDTLSGHDEVIVGFGLRSAWSRREKGAIKIVEKPGCE